MWWDFSIKTKLRATKTPCKLLTNSTVSAHSGTSSLSPLLYLTRSHSQKHTEKHSSGDSMVYQTLIGFHLVPRHCKQNKEGQAALETLVSNPTQEAERSLCSSVTFLLSAQCPLVSFHIRSPYIPVTDQRGKKRRR